MKTTTKAKVIKYIKEHGTEGLTGEWTATINGIKVGLCKSTIVLYNEGYKFPTFHNVTLFDDGDLEFVTIRGRGRSYYNTYTTGLRSDEIIDKYYKVMEDILNNA